MIRSMSILAIAAICAPLATVSSTLAQDQDVCPTRHHSTAETEAATPGKKVEWNHFGLFKTVKLEASTQNTPSPDADQKNEKKHQNEIRVEIGVDASHILSHLPMLKNLFPQKQGKDASEKAGTEPQGGIRIEISNDPTLLPTRQGFDGSVQQASHTTPVDNQPAAGPIVDICPAASGGCCARPDPVCLTSDGCVTGSACCESKKGCCESDKGSAVANRSCTGDSGKCGESAGPCCNTLLPSGNTHSGCPTSAIHVSNCPQANGGSSCSANPPTQLMLANFTEPPVTAGEARLQYMEELLELRVENAELKVALAAAERHAEMLQRMAELREQNAILRAELHLHQAARLPADANRPVPPANHRPGQPTRSR
ncbi:MAG: hypothetical protein MK108_13945 [Mariniblastus sp.]|nr:hypothetical protein [Mariniblastus sp.]